MDASSSPSAQERAVRRCGRDPDADAASASAPLRTAGSWVASSMGLTPQERNHARAVRREIAARPATGAGAGSPGGRSRSERSRSRTPVHRPEMGQRQVQPIRDLDPPLRPALRLPGIARSPRPAASRWRGVRPGPLLPDVVDPDPELELASARATLSASSMTNRATARASGSVAISLRVARVRALSGLKATLPRSLSQISSRIRERTGALRPARASDAAMARQRSVLLPSISPARSGCPRVFDHARTTMGGAGWTTQAITRGLDGVSDDAARSTERRRAPSGTACDRRHQGPLGVTTAGRAEHGPRRGAAPARRACRSGRRHRPRLASTGLVQGGRATKRPSHF